MKAVGYTTCRTCEGTYRGYKPRGWKPGDELATWQHGIEDGAKTRCPGSYKTGQLSRLDGNCPPGGHTWMGEPTDEQLCLCGQVRYVNRQGVRRGQDA